MFCADGAVDQRFAVSLADAVSHECNFVRLSFKKTYFCACFAIVFPFSYPDSQRLFDREEILLLPMFLSGVLAS